MPSITSSTPRLISPMSVENSSRHASKKGSCADVDPDSVDTRPRSSLTAIKATPPRESAVRTAAIAAVLLALAACGRIAPPPDAPAPVAPTARAVPSAPPTLALPTLALPAADPAPGPLYTCERNGAREPLALSESVDRLCRRHPEMGPCQYERSQCRAAGGRVFTARNEEVTPAVEAEYDKRVRRVRLQADGAAPKR